MKKAKNLLYRTILTSFRNFNKINTIKEQLFIKAIKENNLEYVWEMLDKDKTLMKLGYGDLEHAYKNEYNVKGNQLILLTFPNNNFQMAQLLINNDQGYASAKSNQDFNEDSLIDVARKTKNLKMEEFLYKNKIQEELKNDNESHTPSQ